MPSTPHPAGVGGEGLTGYACVSHIRSNTSPSVFILSVIRVYPCEEGTFGLRGELNWGVFFCKIFVAILVLLVEY